ncbi:MAG: betaine--homocysteine S-methyltransferase, partial [Pseudomonadota bacterium]
MRISLQDLLNQRKLLLADGASGTNFMHMGLEPGFPPDIWNVSAPEKPTKLHQMFVDAGSDIILTNTFGANAPRLKLHKAENEVYAINKAGAEIAGAVAEASDRPVVVAGSIGPTGELFVPLGAMTMDDARAAFAEQIQGLKDGGADVAWIETMSAAEEIQAAAEAAVEVGLPYVFTASFDTAGKTMMGLAPGSLGEVATQLPGEAIAFGANCGVGASDLLVSVLAMTDADPKAIVIAKANCGIPVVKGASTEYTGTPELMAEYVAMAADAGVRIIGGCCGTSPDHIAAMREALDSYEAAPRPTLETIVHRIGALVAPPAQNDENAPVRERRGRRRR